jgi:mono/diheme cytochrome c family protein
MKGPDEMNPACIDCHGKGKGPDHTPTEVDADPDPQIQNTFLTGMDPEGREVDYEHEYANLLKGRKHKWSVTMDEAVGVVAYLRSLEPTGYPEWDAPTTEKEN